MKKLFTFNIIPVIALSYCIAITACKKKETDKIIYGAIYYKDSTAVPVANTSFLVHVTYKYGYPSKESNTSYAFSTDASGSFTAKYKSPKQATIHIAYSDQSVNDSYFWSGASSKTGDNYHTGIIYAPRR